MSLTQLGSASVVPNGTSGGGGSGSAGTSAAQGRLTLATGDPAPSTDQTAKTTLYFTPYMGNTIGLYNVSASSWAAYNFSELSISAAALLPAKNYDVFAYLSAGAVALEFSAAWSGDTTRTDALAYQDGIRVKSSDHTRRFLGTVRTTGIGQAVTAPTAWYLCGDAAAADMADAAGGGYTLTQHNSPGAYPSTTWPKRLFTRASSHYFSSTNAIFSPGDASYGFEVAVYSTDVSLQQTILGKWGATAADEEYLLEIQAGVINFYVMQTDTNAKFCTSAAIANHTLYMVRCGYDKANNLIYISLNAGTRVTTATTAALSGATATPFEVGRRNNNSNYLGGEITALGYWKTYSPTTAEDTALYSLNGTGEIQRFPFASVATTLEDSATRRFVLNWNNRLPAPMTRCPNYLDTNADCEYLFTTIPWGAASGDAQSTIYLLSNGQDLAQPAARVIGGYLAGATTASLHACVAIDNSPESAPEDIQTMVAAASQRISSQASNPGVLSEGFHTFTAMVHQTQSAGIASILASTPTTGLTHSNKDTRIEAVVTR
jgi:hypothetical protein